MYVQFTSCVYGVYDLVRFCIALKYSGFYPLTLYCILRENDQIHLQNLAEFAERLLKSDHSGALCITRLSGHMVFFFLLSDKCSGLQRSVTREATILIYL